MPGSSMLRRDVEPTFDGAPARKPHLCFVAPYLWPVLSRDPALKVVGGAEVQQAVLARVFRRAGYRVSVVTLDYGQPDRAAVDGIAVHKAYRPDAGLPVLRFLHPRITSMWRAMREVDADIYYQRSASMLTALVGEFSRRHGKRSIYAGASDVDFLPGRQQIRYLRDRRLFERGLARVDRIVVQNQAQADACREHYGLDAVQIPSCYELPGSSRMAVQDCVLWVATVHDYKRPELFLEIAKRLPHRRFVMIGGSSTPGTRLKPGYFERIREQAAKLPNVEFTGFLPLAQVEPWFDRARVLVNTSVYEGMPNTFMQAWARGVPTAATVDVGARVEARPVYPVFSGAEEGSAEVERLFREDLHWARVSARCREYFERSHSSAEVLKRYEEVFGSLLPEHH